MVRLDAELLARVPSQLNCLKDRELDLRGYKIPAIENLGVTKDQIDALDLTDNNITSLSNLPLLRRLQHVHLAQNPVRTVSPTLPTSLPNLRTLILTNTAVPVDTLGPLAIILGRCKKLETLSLKGSPVAEAKYYKEWIIFKCRHLRSLDFDRVKDKDRKHARSLFTDAKGQPTPLAVSLSSAQPISSNGDNTFEPGVTAELATGDAKSTGRTLTKEQRERVRAAIEGAESVDEIRRLQRFLQQGFV
ncbi:L domain-like protein [Meredithblackwellia eburnea MCA 4105]